MSLKVPVIDTADYRLPPEVEARLGGRDTSWTYPTLLNFWLNFGQGWEPARYRKDTDGRVYIGGMVYMTAGKPVDQQPIFNLPVGYRPAFTRRFAAVNTDSFSEMQVDATNGNVILLAPTVSGWLSFGTLFPVD